MPACRPDPEPSATAMNLRFVEAFHWAVLLKSVTRAAEKLHLTQSALSSRIAALETELGVQLLDRRDKRLRLTPAGQRFHHHALKLLDLQRQVKDELGSGQLRAQVLRLGVIESVVHSWLTDWLDHMRETHAELELELTVETTPLLVDQLQRGRLDLVFAALPAAGDGVRSLALPPMPMAFVGHRQRHRASAWTLQDIAAHDLLTFQRGSQPHVSLLQLLRRQAVEAPRVHAVSSISAMVRLVAIGFGIATLPRAVLSSLGPRASLKALECDLALEPLPLHASFRDDPSLQLIEPGLASVPGFTGRRRTVPGAGRGSSRKSMKP
jgi:DNA-binding transcriptional LysR family regulator